MPKRKLSTIFVFVFLAIGCAYAAWHVTHPAVEDVSPAISFD